MLGCYTPMNFLIQYCVTYSDHVRALHLFYLIVMALNPQCTRSRACRAHPILRTFLGQLNGVNIPDFLHRDRRVAPKWQFYRVPVSYSFSKLV